MAKKPLKALNKKLKQMENEEVKKIEEMKLRIQLLEDKNKKQ